MQYTKTLIEGVFLKRYKRFFADIQFQSETLVAHVANTGSLRTVAVPGQACLFSRSDNPERKLKYSLEAIASPQGGWVGVNTSVPNLLVKELLQGVVGGKADDEAAVAGVSSAPAGSGDWAAALDRWQRFDQVQPEYKISAESRLDFALKKSGTDRMHFIEVKNVTMVSGRTAQFPDAETVRGQKHLRDLMSLVQQGHSAEIIFVIQRTDCDSFAPAAEIDPEYARLLAEASHSGVVVTPLEVEVGNKQVQFTKRVLAFTKT
ncbi:MAG: DNA/RNA nuclease SfsA [Pseudobdellovibrionaceae bacterium]